MQRNKHGIPIRNDAVKRRVCSKDIYLTETAARAIAIIKQVPLRAYLCPVCQSWHLTKQKSLER